MQPAPGLPAQPPLASGVCRRLLCFSTGGVTVGLTICRFCLFTFPPCYVALCASKARHRFGSEKVSWCLETSLFLRLPSRDGTPPLPLSSLFFVFYIFSYLLLKTWVAFLGAWCPLLAFRSCFVEFTWSLNVLLMNLWGRKCSPCPTPPPS